jgi:SpoVK/Ycf46/Vps4 family AAA+-type ATPase
MIEDLTSIRFEDYETDVRVDVLRRLAEQAMSDAEFRAVAREDLMLALRQFGYELNERELDLVLRFRAALAEAGIDVFLQERIDERYLTLLGRMAG